MAGTSKTPSDEEDKKIEESTLTTEEKVEKAKQIMDKNREAKRREEEEVNK